MTGVRELTFLMGRGLGTGTGHKSLNPSFLDSGCKTITLINLTTCKALASLADCIGRPLLQPPSEVLTIYSVLIGGVRGWARSPCFGDGRRGKEEAADRHLIAIEDTSIDPQAGQNRHTLSPGLGPPCSAREQSREEPGSRDFVLKLHGARIALPAHLLPEPATWTHTEGRLGMASSRLP